MVFMSDENIQNKWEKWEDFNFLNGKPNFVTHHWKDSRLEKVSTTSLSEMAACQRSPVVKLCLAAIFDSLEVYTCK